MKRAWVCAAVIAVSLLVSPPAARADESAAAFRAHVQRAKDLYSHGSYEAAAQEYILAYQINPVPGALFNIAQAYRQAGKYEQAKQYFRSYLREKKPEAAERAQVEKQISELNGLIAKEKKGGAFEPPPPGDDFAPPVVPAAKPPPPPVAKKKTDEEFAPPVVAATPVAPTPEAPVVKKTDDDFAPPVVAPKPVPAPVVAAQKPPPPAAIPPKKPAEDFAPPPVSGVVVASPPAPAPIPTRKTKTAAVPAPAIAHDDFAPPPPPKAPPAKVVVAAPPPSAKAPPPAVAVINAPPKPYVAQAPPVAEPDDAVIETRSSARSHTWAYATGGAALALIGAGVYFGVQATRADNELTAGAHSRADADSLINKSHSDHRLEAIFLGVGGAAVVGAGLLYFLPATGPSGGSGVAVAGHF